MKRLSALQAVIARSAAALCLLLSVMSGAALAQTTGTVNPSPAPAQPSADDDVPPGGCMPIGLTVSGEIVFPILCKEFIERHRGMPVEMKPAVVDRPAAKQSGAVAPENSQSANKPPQTAPLSKRAEQRGMSPDECAQRYRSYDPASGTYRSYDGRRRPCP